MRWLLVLLCVGIVAMSCTTNVPTVTMRPGPVATAEAAVYATPTIVGRVETTPTVLVVPTVLVSTTPIVVSTFDHPWPVGTTITAYPDLDELTEPLVDEIIAVLPEYESYVVVVRYIPEVFLVPYGRMDGVLVEAGTGQYAEQYQLVTWSVPGQVPVVLWEAR